MRIDTRTQIAVNLIATEITNKTGKKVSANVALWQFIEDCRSDLAKRATELAKTEKNEDETDE